MRSLCAVDELSDDVTLRLARRRAPRAGYFGPPRSPLLCAAWGSPLGHCCPCSSASCATPRRACRGRADDLGPLSRFGGGWSERGAEGAVPGSRRACPIRLRRELGRSQNRSDGPGVCRPPRPCRCGGWAPGCPARTPAPGQCVCA